VTSGWTGSGRNWASYGAEVGLPIGFAAEDQALLTDPQTSGGLLVACLPSSVDEVLNVFHRHGFERATVVGEVVSTSATPKLLIS
jgi:selenide, water dikinase